MAGLQQFTSARSLVVPDAGHEAAAWIACARSAGVPVLTRLGSRLHAIFGSACLSSEHSEHPSKSEHRGRHSWIGRRLEEA